MIKTPLSTAIGGVFWSPEAAIIGGFAKSLSQLITSLFSNGEQGFAYDISKLTDGSYGANQSGVGQPVTVGVAGAAEYNTSTGVGSVYRADLYNQSIVNFDVDNAKSHELVIENTGSNPIAVNADLAMGTVLFTVVAGQTVTQIIDPVQVIVITSANDVSTANFKIHSLKEFTGSYTMFQDAAGTIPVTTEGQPVGLMLDKSKGLLLGPNLHKDSEVMFNGESSRISDGVYRVYSETGNLSQIFQTLPFELTGRYVEVTVNIESISGRLSTGFGDSPTWSTPGVKKFFGRLLSVGIVFKRAAPSAVDAIIRDISVREVFGNHAYQTTSAARPILQQKLILGNEMVVNGDFSNGLNGWQNALVTATVENGRAKVTYTTGGGLYQDIPVTAGKTYKVSSKAENIIGSQPVLYVYGSAGFSPILASSASSTPTLYVTAVASSIRVYLNKSGAGEAYWDDISVKEVTGYRTDQNYIRYDGVDDKLITNLPAQLTGCTVIRSVPNVGTQILTGQTIPATYEDNKDHCGLIVINRALTPSETSTITAEFNKRAGV